MFEYRKDRFVNAQRIIAANIYQKEGSLKVAIDLDVRETANNCVYSDPFTSIEAARAYIAIIPWLKAA